jgi:hypothetical protein
MAIVHRQSCGNCNWIKFGILEIEYFGFSFLSCKQKATILNAL